MNAGYDMGAHAGHDMGVHAGNSMSGHDGHDMGGMDHSSHLSAEMGSHKAHSSSHGLPNCTMSMIWNADTSGMCIIHRAWNVRTEQQFFMSLLVVMLVSVAYEALKCLQRRLDVAVLHTEAAHGCGNSQSSSRRSRRIIPISYADVMDESEGVKRPAVLVYLPAALHTPARLRSVRSIAYGMQVALACFLMLVMMTYNAWLIAAIVIGAMIGSVYFAEAGETSTICH